MNKINYQHILVSLFFSLFFSCSSDKEEITPQSSDPEVYTFDALLGTKGGVHFSGSFTPNGNVISEAGFEYSVDSLFNNKSKVIAESTSDNQLKYFLSNGIEENIKYYYRAFVKTSNRNFNGDIDSFISDGSVSPEIDSISKEYGHIADTLEIYGKYFKDAQNQTFVEVTGRNSQLISLNDSLIKFIVPEDISSVTNDIQVRIDNRADTYSSFTLYKPTIETIDPIIAIIGDTLSIKGNHFDIANSRNNVFFGAIRSKVIESGRKNIKVVVPENIENISDSISVNAQLQDVLYPISFQLATPEINSISPLNATFRDEITITGDNFDYQKSGNKVYFGNIEATITYADKNTLKVLVPDDIESSSEPIRVEAQLQETVFDKNFQLVPPEISFVPGNVHANQEIVIEGNYFHPVKDRNAVTIEDIEVKLASGDSKHLNTRIPLGPFPRRKAIVKLTLLDLTVEYEVDLNIIDKWIMVSGDLPFRYRRGPNNAVVVNNVAYILAREKDNYTDESLILWKFNSVDFTWKKINTKVPDYITFPNGILETNGSEIFYYTSNSSNEFWKYSLDNNKWTKLSAFPGKRRDYPAHFVIGQDIYIGIGTDILPYSPIDYTDFYKYNILSGQWTQISDLPFDIWGGHRRTGMASFVINDIAYLAAGAANTGDIDAWSYLPGSDSWKQIADFPIANHEGVSFQLNGLGYVTGGAPIGGSRLDKSWTYSPNTNSWEESDSIIQGRGWHFSFVLNGKAYIGGGDNYSGGSPLNNFYEYIP